MSLEAGINKATDATLTTDNWQYVLDVCDAISADPEKNINRSIKIIKTRLAMKDANIVLRSLTLLVAMGENCGSRMQSEIATSSFLKEVLLSRLADKKVHKELKFRIAEVIGQLEKSFRKDPSLKAASDALKTVETRYPQYLKVAPNKPEKKQLTAQDKQNEDVELERALKLSVQEYEREQSVRQNYLNSKPLPNLESNNSRTSGEGQKREDTGSSNGQTIPFNHVSEQKDSDKNDTVSIANVKKVYALYDLISYEPDELSFRKGDVITVIESVYRDWWRGALPNGKTGIFPLNYVTPVVSKTPEELARESKLESALIHHESRKLDRLLVLLSQDPNTVSEEEVTELYNSIVDLKPVLAKLIGKYSGRKDELRALNDQVTKESKTYNDLIDAQIAQRQNTQFGHRLPYPSQNQSSHQNYPQPEGHLQETPQVSSQELPNQPTQECTPSQKFQTSNKPQNQNTDSQHQYRRPQASGPYLDQHPTSAGFGNAASFSAQSYDCGAPVQSQNQGGYSSYTTFPQRENY